MALNLADRLLTIVVTATFTSAVWVVLGTTSLRTTDGDAGPTAGEPSEAPNPAPSEPAVLAPPPGEAGELIVPVAGVTAAQLTDTFSDERDGVRLHEALDIMASRGTRVLAAAPGTVERLFQSDAGGNTIYVRSQDRQTIHYYAHLQDYAPGLSEGQSVQRGQRLGSVGSSGNADPAAPHLHFAIMRTTPDAEWWEPATGIISSPATPAGGATTGGMDGAGFGASARSPDGSAALSPAARNVVLPATSQAAEVNVAVTTIVRSRSARFSAIARPGISPRWRCRPSRPIGPRPNWSGARSRGSA